MRKIFLILLIFVCKFSFAQPTYHGSASTPADNGTNTATTTAVTPPASMTTGDLVVIYAYQRGTSTTFSISATGGQTWTSHLNHNSSTATLSGAVFYCTYNGTWGANPSVLFSAGTNTNVVMLVFRPTTSDVTWSPDNGSGSNDNTILSFSAASPIANGNGWVPSQDNTVSINIWSTDDDNTWGTLTGAGWVHVNSGQFRNTSGSDVSSAYAYLLQGTAASVPSASLSQATLGNDPGIKAMLVYKQVANIPYDHKGGFFKIIKRQK